MNLFKKYHEIPPTAGLPLNFKDWLGKNKSLTESVSEQLDLPELILTCSGTIALVTALTVLKKRYPSRSQVIIPAYTCPLVVLAIHHCGLKIVLCDTAKDSSDFDLNQLEQLVNQHVLAVLPTHLGGRIADVPSVKKIAKPFQITVIEDAAQALGAKVGIDGDIVFFSLAVGKGLTLYEGGLLTANDDKLRGELAAQAAKIPFRLFWEMRRTIELLGYTSLYNPFGLYFVYGQPKREALRKGNLIEVVGDDFDFKLPMHRVSQFRQSVAANALIRLPDFMINTKFKAQERVSKLEQIANVSVIHGHTEREGTWPFLMVLLPSKLICKRVLDILWPSGLGISRLFIHSLPEYAYLRSIISEKSMPNAEDFAERMLTITNSLWLSEKQFDHICQIIRSQINQNNNI